MENERITDTVWVPKNRKEEWISELEKEFGKDIRFYVELRKDAVDAAFVFVKAVFFVYDVYKRYLEYKRKRQAEGFPVKDQKPNQTF